MFDRGFWRFALLTAYACLALSAPAIAQEPPLVDKDKDGLIEIYTLSDLNNIRHSLDGKSSKTSEGAEGITEGCPPGGCRGYELMNDLDFDTNDDSTVTATDSGGAYWNDGDGWEPIGGDGRDDNPPPFTATFDGNGYKIANLFINRDSENAVGLFGAMGNGGEIRNLGVVDATVSGNFWVGGLVGDNSGTIRASYAAATVSGNRKVGGLVGPNSNDGTIRASYALATVTGVGDAVDVGGLVGDNRSVISESYALATVSGNARIGGLVGSDSRGDIRASYALATVMGIGNDVGGLVGSGTGTVRASYALATVSGNERVGGLVGFIEFGPITASYALATVSGNKRVGGLVGDNNATIRASYALATVSGSSSVGGLVGWNDRTIRASYALATVMGTGNDVGGLVGTADGTVEESYFDADITAQTHADRGKTTSQLQTPDDYEDIYMSWNVDVGGVDTEPDDPWDFGGTMQYPALALPRLATGACPAAISPAVMIGMAEGQCIHRPVSRFASVELDDDRGARFDGIIFTNKRNPRIDAQLLLPKDSTVRVAVAGMPEISTPTRTDADGRVTLEVNLAEAEEDPNVFDAVGVVQLSDGTTNRVSLGTLTITLDMTSPTLTVFYREADGRFYADEVADNLTPAPIIRYEQLAHASSNTCTQGHFSGRDLTDLKLYDPNPANAERFLPALAPDGAGNVGVYCFVAEDAAGNRTVESSANAVPAPVVAPAPAPVALRLRLRVFLESALP